MKKTHPVGIIIEKSVQWRTIRGDPVSEGWNMVIVNVFSNDIPRLISSIFPKSTEDCWHPSMSEFLHHLNSSFIWHRSLYLMTYDFLGFQTFNCVTKLNSFLYMWVEGTEPFDEFHSSRSCNSTSIVNDLDRLWKCSNGSKGPNSAKKHKQKHCNQQSSELNCHMAFEAIRLSLPLCI